MNDAAPTVAPSTLGSAFLDQLHKAPRHTAIHDPGGSMNRVTLGAVALGVRDLLEREVFAPRVGVMLPPGRGGAVVNLALALAGRTSVNLNHTAGEVQLRRMAEIAGLTTIITAQKYLDKINIAPEELPGRVLLADVDLLPGLSKLQTVGRIARLRLAGARGLLRMDHGAADDVATILFSSGTTGDPKGIQLTHAQILANIHSVHAALDLHDGHVLLSALPLFHSFGLVPGMWLPLTTGITLAGFPNPRDPAGFGKLAEQTSSTCMLSTPTFCRQYLKKIPPQRFSTLQFAVVGAEKCPAELKSSFYEQFRAHLLEGYGCTELAPVVSANLLDAHVRGRFAAGGRDGSVGRPLPNIEALIVDPESLEELPRGEEGLIVVRSPARMLGYLGRDDLTAKAFVRGGYNTGDIGRLDEDGFLFITGRLARFAKIGGEMIPLDTIEDHMQSWLERKFAARQSPAGAGRSSTDDEADDAAVWEIAITAVPDAAKGERLIVLHTGLPCAEADALQSLTDFPPLFRPRARDFFRVDEIPVLGTGKRNLKAVKELAVQIAAAPV